MVQTWSQQKLVLRYGHKHDGEIMSHADIVQKSAKKTSN